MCLPCINSKGGFLNALVTCQHQVKGLCQSVTPGETRDTAQRLPAVSVAAVPVVLAVCCSLMAVDLFACLHSVGPVTWSAVGLPHFNDAAFLHSLVTYLHQATHRKQVADKPTPPFEAIKHSIRQACTSDVHHLCGLIRVA